MLPPLRSLSPFAQPVNIYASLYAITLNQILLSEWKTGP